MKLAEHAVVGVLAAEHLSDYRIRMRFSDGTERVVDFGPFLRASLNPATRAYLAFDRFASFTVANGDLLWGDHDLCFPVADLYEGSL